MAKINNLTVWKTPNYYQYNRGWTQRDGRKIRGTFYHLCKALNDAEKQALLDTYTNVFLYVGQAQYAPELKHNVLFVADHTPRQGRATA